ncbi:MAG: DUF4474 domain-containing protein [Clostridiales bacterium]|nr:DUF4474 domain-containing protein [Clostridiales bacterium]
MFLIISNKLVAKITSISILWNFYIQNKVLTITVLVLLLIAASLLLKSTKGSKKKGKDKTPAQPITQLIGSTPERLEELNKDLNPFGFAYDINQDIFYSVMDGWQRKFGYCRLYDEGCAPFSMIIDCEPIYFNYGGMKWLIEFWKGQYGMTTGGEVGIYYTNGPSLNIPGVFNGTFYHCVKDKDRINMYIAFKKNGEIMFTRNEYHWWLTGFMLAEFSHPSELTMDIILELYNRNMAEAFVGGLIEAGYNESEYHINGNKVYIQFDKPHTKQPISRNALTEYLMQRNNQSFCNAYNYLTAEYSNTLDKLAFVKRDSPYMYDQIVHMGKPQEVFEKSYNKIQGYINTQDMDGVVDDVGQ